MDDGRKFLRYIVPAFVYLIEIILFLSFFLVLNPSICTFNLFNGLSYKDHILEIIIMGFIVSGGLGAFFCQIYHVIYSFGVVDLRKSIINAMKKGCLKVTGEGKALEAESIENCNKRISLMIDTVLWSQRSELNNKIKGAKDRTQTYHDHLHGVGGVIVATFFAFISWLLIVISTVYLNGVLWFNPTYWFIIILWVLLIVIFFLAYLKLKEQLIFHRYSILMDVLGDDFIWRNNKPAEIDILWTDVRHKGGEMTENHTRIVASRIYFIVGILFLIFYVVKNPGLLDLFKKHWVEFIWCSGWGAIGIGLGLYNSRNNNDDHCKRRGHYYLYFIFVWFIATFTAFVAFGAFENNAVRSYIFAALTGIIVGFIGDNLPDKFFVLTK